MNIYGSPLWKYYDKKLLERFYVAWRKSQRRVWNISNVTHHNLLPYIHNCHPIEVLLEKIRLWVKMYAISTIETFFIFYLVTW